MSWASSRSSGCRGWWMYEAEDDRVPVVDLQLEPRPSLSAVPRSRCRGLCERQARHRSALQSSREANAEGRRMKPIRVSHDESVRLHEDWWGKCRTCRFWHGADEVRPREGTTPLIMIRWHDARCENPRSSLVGEVTTTKRPLPAVGQLRRRCRARSRISTMTTNQ